MSYVAVQMVENHPLGKQINPATGPFSETPTEDKKCHLCKRFPVRFEHGEHKICMRCEHHMTEFGKDDDFKWAVQNVIAEDGLNLRFSSLKDERTFIENNRLKK